MCEPKTMGSAPDREPGRTPKMLPTGDVGIAERHTANAALRIRAELGEVGEVLVHARAVHAPALPVPLLGECAESDDSLDELAALHVTAPCRSPFSTTRPADRSSHPRRVLSAG